MRARKAFLATTSVILALALAGLLAEGAVRLLAPQPMSFPRFYAPDPRAGFRLAPEHSETLTTGEYSIHVRTNSLGCRGPEPRNRPGDVRVLVLGDSFMFGYGVDDANIMCARLPAALTQRTPGASYDVLDAGVPGYGPLEYRLRYEELRDAFRPRVVVIGIYVGNDLFDCLREAPENTVQQGFLVSTSAPHFSAWRAWIRLNLHSYRLASSVLQRIRLTKRDDREIYADKLSAMFVGHPGAEGPAGRDPWPQFEVAMRKLIGEIRADGLEVIPVIVPMRIQVDGDAWARFVREIGKGQPDLDRFLPQTRMRALFAELGVPYLDLTPVFAAQGAGDNFLRLDGHWSARGHALATEYVADEIARVLHAGAEVASWPPPAAVTSPVVAPARAAMPGAASARRGRAPAR
jgi:hypothetical protein